jgi:hypothetical protein
MYQYEGCGTLVLVLHEYDEELDDLDINPLLG